MAYSSRNQHPAQERRHDGQAEISAHPSKGFFFFFPACAFDHRVYKEAKRRVSMVFS